MQINQTEEYYFLKFTLLSNHQRLPLPSSNSQLNVQIEETQDCLLNMERIAKSNDTNELFPQAKDNSSHFYQISLYQSLTQKNIQQTITFKCYLQQPFFETTETKFDTTIRDLFKRTQKAYNHQKRILISNDYSHKLQVIIIRTQQPKSFEALEKIIGQGESKITVDSLTKFQNLTTEGSIISTTRRSKFKRTVRKNAQKFERRTRRTQLKNLDLLKESRVSQKEFKCPKSMHSLRFLGKTSKLVPLQQYNNVYEIDDSETWEQIKKSFHNKVYIFTLFIELVLMFMLMWPSSKL